MPTTCFVQARSISSCANLLKVIPTHINLLGEGKTMLSIAGAAYCVSAGGRTARPACVASATADSAARPPSLALGSR